MKHKLILILLGAAITLGVSCSPVAPAPTPKIDTAPRPDATAIVAMTPKPTPAEAATLPRIVAPSVNSAPTEAVTQLRTVTPAAKPTSAEPVTRLWTAGPITQTGPSIGKDKSNMNGVPIPVPLDPPMEKIVMQAKEDLAKRLAINIDQISLVEVQSVVWPDGGLGCPQPGMLYTQVQVDGLLIRFRASGQLYEYHSGGSRPPFLCKSNQ